MMFPKGASSPPGQGSRAFHRGCGFFLGIFVLKHPLNIRRLRSLGVAFPKMLEAIQARLMKIILYRYFPSWMQRSDESHWQAFPA